MTPIRGGRPPGNAAPPRRETLPRRSTAGTRSAAEALAQASATADVRLDDAALAYETLINAGSAGEVPQAPARQGVWGWLASARDSVTSLMSTLASSRAGGALGALVGASALVAGGGPALAAQVDAPPAAPTGPVAGQVRPTHYTVAAGDTLSDIAARHGVKLHKLILYNADIRDPNLIFPGQELVLPPGAHAPRAPASVPATKPPADAPAASSALDGSADSTRGIRTPDTTVAAPPDVATATPGLILPDVIAGPSAAPASAASAAAASVVSLDTTVTPATRADAARDSTARRILRWIDERLVDQATRSSVSVKDEVDLGVLGKGALELRPLVRISDTYSTTRTTFEEAEKAKGKDVVWLETLLTAKLAPPASGIVVGDAAVTPGGSLELSITRPLVYSPSDLRLPRAAAHFADRITSLPLSSEALGALEPGSRVLVRGEGSLAATDGVHATPSAKLEGRLELRLDKLEGSRVEASLSSRAAGSALSDRDGTRADAAVSRNHDRSFTLDLATPGGKAALAALLRLDGAGAEALATSNTAGVKLDGRTRVDAGSGGVLHTTDTGLRAGLRTSRETRVDDSTTARTDSTSAELGRAARDGRPEVRLAGARDTRAWTDGTGALPTTEAELRASTGRASLDRTTRGSLDAHWTGDTDTTLRAALERREVLERTTSGGERRELGSIELGAKLTETKGHLGGDYEVRYELKTPLDHARGDSLPLDAAAFRALPATSRLELIEATSHTAAWRPSRGELSLAASSEGAVRMRVVVERGAGDTAEVRVVRFQRSERARSATLSDVSAARRVELSAHSKAEGSLDLDRTFSLDLSQPAHARAFARLLEGDVQAASSALGQEAPAVVRDGVRELGAKLGVKATDRWGVGVELVRRTHEPSSALVTGDTDRAALGARWTERVGLVSPQATLSKTVPLGDGTLGSVKAGVTTEGLLEFRQITPEADDRVLSLGADDVLTWTRGSEVTLRGKARATGFVDVGLGHSATLGPATVAARAGVADSHSADKSYLLGVRKTEGTKVAVELRETASRTDALAAFAKVGATTDLKVAVDLPAGSARNDAIIKILERADRALGEKLAASIEGSLSSSTERDHKTEVELDLAEPRGRSVFEALRRFDAEAARALAGTGLSISDTDTLRKNTHVSASLFGWDAYRADTSRTDAQTLAAGPAGRVSTDASSYRATSKSILGRERTLEWQAVSVQRDSARLPELMYRVQFQDKDELTSRRQVESLMALVDGLQVTTARAPRIEKAPERGLVALLGKYAQHGQTQVDLEVYLTRSGLERLSVVPQEAAWRAFGQVVTASTGATPGWAKDGVATEARVMLAEHVDTLPGSEPIHDKNSQYWWLTGRNLHQDKDSYVAARSFTEMVRRVGDTPSPVAWNKAFADLGQQTGYPFYDALSAMNTLTGPSGVLVKRLHMTGPSVDIEAVGTGFVELPRP